MTRRQRNECKTRFLGELVMHPHAVTMWISSCAHVLFHIHRDRRRFDSRRDPCWHARDHRCSLLASSAAPLLNKGPRSFTSLFGPVVEVLRCSDGPWECAPRTGDRLLPASQTRARSLRESATDWPGRECLPSPSSRLAAALR